MEQLRRRRWTAADAGPSSAADDDDAPRRWSEDSADAVRDHLLGTRSPPGAWSGITSTEPRWPDLSPSPSPKAENIPLPATPPAEAAPAAPEAARGNEVDDDEPLCRICFLDASASVEDPSLGRLIQPCHCRGTQARVHVGCLQRWRRTSASRASFWKCDQCGFRYQLRRTKVAGLAENRWAKGGVTLGVFLLLVTVAGYIAGYLVEASVVRGGYEDSISPQTFAGSSWTDLWGYSFGMGYGYYDTSGRLMGDALGEAVRVLNKQLNVDTDASDETTLAAVESSEDGSSPYRYRRIINTPRPVLSDGRVAARSERFQGSLPPWVWRRLQGFIEHQIMGLAFVGILSFFQLLISITFFSPLNYGLRNTVFRMIRGNRRDGDGVGLGSSMILLMVLLGLLKAFHAVWKAVGVLSQWMLSRLEDSVLDVR